MKLINRIKVLAMNPAMQWAYARWAFNRAMLRRDPKVVLGTASHLASWASFSEFWSFRDGVPQAEHALIRRVLRESKAKVAFDVGANVGAFTCLLPELGAREVHAFEPVPETFCRLKANMEANGLLGVCRLNCLAVGKENALVTFRVQAKAAATNRLHVSAAVTAPSSASLQTVAAVRLDDYCRYAQVTDIDFLKIDVEGMEPFALEGAAELFKEKRIRIALIEICPVNLRSVGLSPEILHAAITQTGYTACSLRDDGSMGQPLTLADIQATRLANAVLLPS